MTQVYHYVQPPLFVFSKVCKYCNPPTEKPIEEFDRDRNKPDGRATMCKACSHERHRKRWALLHPTKEAKDELTDLSQIQKRERQHESNRRYRLNNHEKELARKRAYSTANRERINEQQNTRYQEAVDEYRAKQPPIRDGYKICATCKGEKPFEQFYKQSATNDGYDYSCKMCKDRASGYKHIGKLRNKPLVQPGYKWCYSCESEKPCSDFSPDKTKHDGLRTKCNDCCKVGRQRYWQENRERLRLIKHIYHQHHYASHLEEYRAKLRERSRQPRYRLLITSALSRRRARLALASTEEVDFRRIIERDGYHCYVCDQAIDPTLRDGPARLTFDHVIPIARSGTHTEENIKPAHRACNQRKNARLLSEMDAFQRRGPT